MEITTSIIYSLITVLIYVFFANILFNNIVIEQNMINDKLKSIKAFLTPIFMVLILTTIEFYFSDYFNLIFDVNSQTFNYYMFVTIIEESIKFICLLLFIKIFKYDFYDTLNVVKISILIWLSFWTVENMFYLVNAKDIFLVFTTRTIFSIPLHMIASLMVYIGIYTYIKYSIYEKKKIWNIIILLVYILLPHTLFNVFITYGWPFTLITMMLIFIFAYPVIYGELINKNKEYYY